MLYLLRRLPVKTLKHIPKFLPKDEDFKNTALINDDEHEKLRLTVLDVKNQLFVETATWGLSDWERVLNLPSDGNLDYKTRRAKILSKLGTTYIVTLSFINYLINLFVADKTGYAVDIPEKYLLEIMLPDNKITDFKALDEILKTYIPAHIGWKYIGYVQPGSGEETEIDGIKTTANPIYIGSAMTSYFYMEIPADTTYEISDMEAAQCNVIGVVKTADIINIPADYMI